MARSRTLSPLFFKDEDLAACGKDARIAFLGLLTLADREGRLHDRPLLIKAEIFPFDDVDVSQLLDELARPRRWSEGSFITRYEVDGKNYIQINKFAKYQHPHPKESESSIPPCPGNGEQRKSRGKQRKDHGEQPASSGNSGTSRALPSFPSFPSPPTEGTPADAVDPAGGISWLRATGEVLVPAAWESVLLTALADHSRRLDELDPAGPPGVRLDGLEFGEGVRRFGANLVKTRARPSAGDLPVLLLDWLKSDLTRKRETLGGRKNDADSFRELDRGWGNRETEAAQRIASCKRDHEREAVRGDPHREGFVVEWCPDGCGWQRRVELEAKG